MKALRDESFRPVTLILETQAEVDGVFALFDHAKICRAAGLEEVTYKVLEQWHNSTVAGRLHNQLKALLK